MPFFAVQSSDVSRLVLLKNEIFLYERIFIGEFCVLIFVRERLKSVEGFGIKYL